MKYQLPDNIDQHWLWKDDPAKFQWWLLLLREVGDGETERMVRGVETSKRLRANLRNCGERLLKRLRHSSENWSQKVRLDAKLTQN